MQPLSGILGAMQSVESQSSSSEGKLLPLPSITSSRQTTRRNLINIFRIGMLSRWLFVASTMMLMSATAPCQSYPSNQNDPSNQGEGSGAQVDCTDPRYADTSDCAQFPPASSNGKNSDSSGNYQSEDTNRRQDLQGDRNQTYTDAGGLTPNSAAARNRINRTQAQEPPEPPTEFQRLVQTSTGQILPIFGHDLFRGVPSTFAPVDQVPVTSDYTIGPGDELLIRIWGQVSFNNRLTVDRTGSIYLPQVGAVHVAGLSYGELESHLRSEVGRVFRNFELTVNLGQLRSIQVFVVGQVRHPGNYTVSSFSTLINAIFAAGGLQARGSFRHILLKRQGKTVSDFDFYDLLLQGDKTRDSRLQSGDVIFVPPVGPQIGVAGSVRNPAIYELRGATSLDQILQMAGGLSTTASSSRLSLERIDEHRDRQVMLLTLDAAGRDTPLQDGDVVRIVPLSARYEKSVTIRGNLANPGRFEWHPGMRLSELIPDRASLLTNDYWAKRNRLGAPNPFFAEPRRAVVRPLQQQGDAPAPTFGQESSNSSIASRQTDTPGGTSQSPYAAPSVAQSEAVAVSAPVDVTIPVPEIDWSYAVIERLDPDTLRNSLVPFNLGKLVIDHDASQDLDLQPGDIVTIFSHADIRVPIAQQTKYVRIEGEFNSAGVYSVLPGETLHQLVTRAGGLTSKAYLYGSDFTRESTRVLQQRRLDEYVSQLTIQAERDISKQTTSALSPQDAATAAGSANSERQLVARLRLMRATGRIVLELKPASSGVDALPDLQLEDGDSFVVPSPPDSVNVVGAVYNQGAFLFNRNRRVRDYLKLAGNYTRSADPSHAFIIRADGSVLGRQSTRTYWSNGFDALGLNPGDSIVVPEKIFKPSAIRSLQDWTAIFSQFALGAAAINVIK
jgi:protein involved in polysaccharide export with SLBB domain